MGTPEVVWQGEPLDLPRRQVRALLYYLAAEARPVCRDSLCFLFWPDAGETTARHNLSRLLTLLHSALPDPAILAAHDEQLELRCASVWSDTRALDELTASWRTFGSLDTLRRAADMVRGPFLDGFCLPDSPEFDLWVSQQRERWERMALQTLAALVDALALDGDYTSAIPYAQRALAIDELAEDVQRRLIELYALAGQRSASLCQYERCVAVLERELGVDPAPETQAIYRAVLRGDAAATIPASPPLAAPLLASEPPLLGRVDELRALDEACRRARAGRGGAVLLAGEPGIGKSRLLREFARCVRREVLLVSGVCYTETRASPYQPLVEALRPHLAMRRLEFDGYPAWLADLAQLFPELRPAHPGLASPPACEPGWARTRLFEALESLLLHLSSGVSPIVLCLDNLHWADSATLDWLAYLGRHLAGRPILLVGAYRHDEAGPLSGLRAGLARQGLLRELALEGLDTAGVGELLRRLGSALPSDPTLSDRLCQATGGNPFFLLETIAALVAAKAEQPGDESPWPLPATVCQAVQRRLERLSPTARQTLEAAAVLGPAPGCDALRLTAGRAELELADALDELATQQFVIQEPGSIRFRHEIVAGVVYRGLSAYRRQLLHRRAAEALQRVQPDAAAALARHLAAAGLPGQAARYALQAGLAAKQVFAHAEARSHFDQALALLALEAAGLRDPAALAENRRLRMEALGERGWALRLLGDMAAFSRDLDEEARLASALDDPAALARLRWRQASAHLWFCRYGEARAAAEEGLRLSRAAGDEFLQAACLRALGLVERECGDYDLAQQSLELALEGFARLDQPSLRLHTLGNLSTLALYQGDPARALDLAQQALAVCETAGCDPDRRVPLGDIGAAAAALGDVELARQSLEQSLAIARQISDRTQEIFCLGHLGWLAVREGQAAPALDHLRAALALAEQVNSRSEQPTLHAGLAEALWLAGDPAAAHAQQAVDLAEATGQAHAQGLAQQVQTRVFAQ